MTEQDTLETTDKSPERDPYWFEACCIFGSQRNGSYPKQMTFDNRPYELQGKPLMFQQYVVYHTKKRTKGLKK